MNINNSENKNKNKNINLQEHILSFFDVNSEDFLTASKLNIVLQNNLVLLTVFIIIFTYIIFIIKIKKSGFFIFNFNPILINCTFILIFFLTNLNIKDNNDIFDIYFNFFFILFILLYNKTITKIYNYEEFILLILIFFSTKMLLVNNNVIALILLIEIQTFCIIILNLSNKQNILKSEATLKYFIISSITSGLFLFGFSNLYFITGSINLDEILLFVNFISLVDNSNHLHLFLSIFLIFISLIIKLGFFPFHNWLLDLYNGFSFNLIFIMFTFQKPILFFLLYKIFSIYSLFFIYNPIIIKFIVLTSILSIVIGSIGIILQSNIKKFLGYSSLVTNSYLLLLLLNDYYYFNIFFIIFIIIYNINNFLLFFFFQNLNFNYRAKNILELYNYYYINKFMTILLIISLFSFLGLPPFSGFFSKYFVIFILNLNNYLSLTLIILLLNIISSFYYLRIIKILISNEKFSYNTNSLEYIDNKNKKSSQISKAFIYDVFIFLFIINLFLFFKLDFFIYLQQILKG